MPDATIIKTFLTLSSVVALLAVILFVIKKYSKKNKENINTLDLKVISRTTLQPKTHVYIVKAGLKTLLLGVSDHNISTLADLSENIENKDTLPTKQLALPNQNMYLKNKLETDKYNPNADVSTSFVAFLQSRFKKS